tara:strand:- start:23 stop:1708 length:1686 start_codon:yes stop_codon:yes gene_type:complete
MSKKKETLYIYCRVSTIEQAKKGSSLKTQEAMGRKVAKKLGMKAEVRNEKSASSSVSNLANRYEAHKLMIEVGQGKVKHIYVSEISRLGRNSQVWYGMLAEMIKHKVKLYQADGQIYNLQDADEKLMVTLLSAIAVNRQEKRTIRFAINKVQKFKDGYYVHGNTIFGYKKVSDGKGKKLAECDVNGKHLKQMFKIYARTGKTRDVQDYLLKNNVLTIRGKTKLWKLHTIRKILANQTYIGKVHYNDRTSNQIFTNTCKRLVSNEIWFEVQKKLKESNVRKSPNQKRDYLLSGLLYCSVCGKLYNAIYNEKAYIKVYKCSSLVNTRSKDYVSFCDSSKNKSVNIDLIDNLVWETFCNTIKDSHVMREMRKNAIISTEGDKSKNLVTNQTKDKKEEKKLLLKSLDKVDKSRLTILKMFTAQAISEKELNVSVAELQKQADELNYKIEQADIFINELKNTKKYIDWYAIYMKEVDNWLKIKKTIQKKKILEKFVEQIFVEWDEDDKTHRVEMNLRLALFDDVYNLLERVGRKRKYEVEEGTKSKTFYLHESKKGRKKKIQVSQN